MRFSSDAATGSQKLTERYCSAPYLSTTQPERSASFGARARLSRMYRDDRAPIVRRSLLVQHHHRNIRTDSHGADEPRRQGQERGNILGEKLSTADHLDASWRSGGTPIRIEGGQVDVSQRRAGIGDSDARGAGENERSESVRDRPAAIEIGRIGGSAVHQRNLRRDGLRRRDDQEAALAAWSFTAAAQHPAHDVGDRSGAVHADLKVAGADLPRGAASGISNVEEEDGDVGGKASRIVEQEACAEGVCILDVADHLI